MVRHGLELGGNGISGEDELGVAPDQAQPLVAGDLLGPCEIKTMTSKLSSTRLALATLALAALSVAAQAGTPVNVSQGLTLAGAPLAIHGYDPVAFFTEELRGSRSPRSSIGRAQIPRTAMASSSR